MAPAFRMLGRGTAALGRLALGHLRWLRRGLSGGQARMVVVYLCFLFLLGGVAVGYLLAPRTAQERFAPAPPRTPPPASPPPPGTKWVEVKTTAYCPCAICCGKHADGRTAINRRVTRFPYGIAVAPKLIPYRTWLFIPGYGQFMVDDTGVAMRDSASQGVVHLDLRFKTHQQARKWGVRWLWIGVPESAPAAKHGYPRESDSDLADRR